MSRSPLLLVLLPFLLGVTFTGTFTIEGEFTEAGTFSVEEFHDAIDASCTGFDITREEADTQSCDAGNARIAISSASSVREGLVYYTGSKPTNTAVNTSQKALVTAASQGDIDDARIGFLFGGGSPDICTGDGTIACYKDRLSTGGELSCEAKCWDNGASAVDAADNSLFCGDTGGPFTVNPGDTLIVQIDGTPGVDGVVNAWAKATDPCTSNCNGTDLGTPDASIDLATECPSPPVGGWITTGNTAGFYQLTDGAVDFQLDGDYAIFQIPEAVPFARLNVSIDDLSPSALEGASPANITATITNTGTAFTIAGTTAVSSVQDCQPTTGGNTTWVSMVAGTFAGVTTSTNDTDDATFATTTCEPGSYTFDLVTTCTNPEGCTDSPDSQQVTTTISAASTEIAVAPSPAVASMTVGGAVPSNLTVTVSNPGSQGTHSGTVALQGTPEDCNPSGTANTTWLSLVDTTYTNVSTVATDTVAMSYAGATNCDEGNWEATVRFICTSGDDCDNDPLDITYRLTVSPVSTGVSAACTAAGSDCYCSEPLNVPASEHGQLRSAGDATPYNPGDSTGAKQCNSNGPGNVVRFLTSHTGSSEFISAASVGLPGTHTLTSVLELTTRDSLWLGLEPGNTNFNLTYTDQTFCHQVYIREDPSMVPQAGGDNDIKLFQADANPDAFVCRLESITCGESGKSSGWIYSYSGTTLPSTTTGGGVSYDDISDQGWGVFSQCRSHNWDGTDRHQIKARYRALHNGATTTFSATSTNSKTSASQGGVGVTDRMRMWRGHTDFLDGSDIGKYRRVSMTDVYLLPADEDFWPPANCEIEGGC